MQNLLVRGAMVVTIALGLGSAARAGQLGTIVAPGPLSKAHASLEGVTSCATCHGASRQESAERCLACHKPIAQRIARKAGLHRAVTDNCASCHAEHRGDIDIRRFDQQAFDHAVDAGLPLDGEHAPLARKCAACHPKRSFLEARPTCSACHADVHKGTLGSDCTPCHATRTPFKEARKAFDHNRTHFVLTGAHRTVVCEKCHAGGKFTELRFDTCTACHQEPHRRTLGPSCTTCHNTGSWATRTLDHARTSFALAGAHTQVACAKCHPAGPTVRIAFGQCSACHVNVHRQSVKEDCRACHDERSFRNAAKFDHAAKTVFALAGKHDGLACRKCHTSITPPGVPLARQAVDFGGLDSECVSCHEDKHKGEFGRACEACHRVTKFSVAGFEHPRSREFFADQHAPVACVKCHVPAPRAMTRTAPVSARSPAPAPSMECRTCHADVHLGQVGVACERCHAINAAKFAAPRFSHQRIAFPLTGKHQLIACAKCHPKETRAFPAGTGTAMRLTPLASECRQCHDDPHLGQVDTQCKACHTTASFAIFSYKHTGQSQIFSGLHSMLRCQACHTRETAKFPGGHGTAVRFKVGTACTECHPKF